MEDNRVFLVRYRTQLSNIVGVAMVALLCIADNRLQEVSHITSGLLMLFGCVLVGLAIVGRLWCSLYIAGRKTECVVQEGPYSLCRNPLYFFSFLGVFGVGCCTETFTFAVLLLAFFIAVYPKVIRAEEMELRQLFGKEYEDYCARVPRFFPKLRGLVEPVDYTVHPKTFRREVFDAMWFVWLVGILELLEILKEMGILPALVPVY